jgi:hypothetical protein
MLPDTAVPLAEDSPGCALETRPRQIQNGTNPPIYYVTLNRDWLSQLGICEQGAATLHSLATRPVEVRKPAIIIQSAEVVEW